MGRKRKYETDAEKIRAYRDRLRERQVEAARAARERERKDQEMRQAEYDLLIKRMLDAVRGRPGEEEMRWALDESRWVLATAYMKHRRYTDKT